MEFGFNGLLSALWCKPLYRSIVNANFVMYTQNNGALCSRFISVCTRIVFLFLFLMGGFRFVFPKCSAVLRTNEYSTYHLYWISFQVRVRVQLWKQQRFLSDLVSCYIGGRRYVLRTDLTKQYQPTISTLFIEISQYITTMLRKV